MLCVPVCPLAFQPSLASKTHLPPPSTRLTSLRCHERPISFHVNAGLTPAPRPSISAREMCGDPLHERRREPGAARFKMCASPPRPTLAHAQAAAPHATTRPDIRQHQVCIDLTGLHRVQPFPPTPGPDLGDLGISFWGIFKKTVTYQADIALSA